MQYALKSPEAARCIEYLETLLRHELQQSTPDVARLSIALGAVELSLTPKDASKQKWPADLPGTVNQLAAAFEAYVGELAGSGMLQAEAAPAAKVKAVADAVWSKLNKGYSKDLQHAQHVYNFAALLLPGGMPGLKRQLDCAGVVTTSYALCHALSRRYQQHAELAAARMQISEDHCWIQLSNRSDRETTVEVTTDTAAKRGLPVSREAWEGWLYTGGHAVLCSPHAALAALVSSLNPAISGGKKGTDSEELQAVQQRLLEVLAEVEPSALYPAALCALADLKEVAAQDALDAARDSGDAAQLAWLLQRRLGDSQELFERAIRLASGGRPATGATNGSIADSEGKAAQEGDGTADGRVYVALRIDDAGGCATVALCLNEPQPQPQPPPPPGQQQQESASNGTLAVAAAAGSRCERSLPGEPGWMWYCHSYLAAYLARRAQFLGSCGEQHWDAAMDTFASALQAASCGAAVLARYRFSPSTDEQLHNDVEGVLEEVCRDGLLALAKSQPGGQISDPAPLASLLLLWDGVCQLFAGKAKPSGWVALVLKAAKLFSPEAREAAAAAVEGRISSGPMVAARQLWRDLKPVPLKPLFESADVTGGDSGPGARAAKRQRR